jgi:diaminohydroxyphosphoribosylaminopyrimidine deaminase/5-amino-6-(5-phosphoribosylamino)uracil reductase
MNVSTSKTETAAVDQPATNGYNRADIDFSLRALELAAKGIGLVSPNPLVGCVIVSADGEVVGEGFYTYDGVTHAEVIALEQAGERARGGTAYVSLEPHSHQGKTAPCTDALIDAGIKRVVAPIEDPNPLVSGRGFQRLRDAGIEVTTGILADEAISLNEKFICWHKKRRPFVHLKLAMSLDGRISLHNSISTALTSEAARNRVQGLRHECDAILVGANTAVVDDPMLTDRSGKERRRSLVRVVLDDRLRVRSDSKLADTNIAPTIVFTKTSDKTCASELTSRGVDVIETEAGSRDLDAVLHSLAEREIQSILVEGGSQVAGAFVDAGLVDKITLIAAPLIIGGGEAPVAIGGRGAQTIAESLRLQNVSVKQLGNDIEITGYPSQSGIDNV